MQFLVKLVLANVVIVACSLVAKKRPELAGLIAVMPLTGFIVMMWVYHQAGGETSTMVRYARGAVWGILPSIIFFAAAWLGFHKTWELGWVLAISFGLWIIGAVVHQYLL